MFDNLLFLKWCAELGIGVSYNLLLPIPGSTADELGEQLRILELVPHLPAPHPMRLLLVRGSAYVNNPRAHGLRGVRPDPFYRELFPPGARPGRLAYQYVCQPSDGALAPLHDATVQQALQWQRVAGRARLHWRFNGSRGVLEDQRNPALRPERVVLEGAAARAFDALMDRALRVGELAPALGGAAMDELVRQGFVLSADGRLLALATRAAA